MLDLVAAYWTAPCKLAMTLATTTAEHGAVVSNGPGKFKIPWNLMEEGFRYNARAGKFLTLR